MLNDNSWRKLPRDLLTDEDFRWVECQLPEHLQFAPYMFYIAALRKADDDGMFDLEDGALFAQLMRIKEPSIVFFIVNKLRKRGIIYRVGETSVCGFCNWDYPQKEKPRTMEQRRQLVMQRIEEKNKVQAVTSDFPTGSTRPDETTECKQTGEPATTAPKSFCSGADFFCPENDKNAENVVSGIYDDKNAKNVVKEGETERKKEIQSEKDQLIQEKKDTHTDKISQTESKIEKEPAQGYAPIGSAPPCTGDKTSAVAQKDFTDMQDLPENDSNVMDEAALLAQQALQAGSEGVEKETAPDVESYLNEFFAKNCYGYKPAQARSAMKTLCKAINELGDDVNPPSIVAAVLSGEFKRMHDGKAGEYWKDIPLLPSTMIKPNVWEHLLTHAGKILAAKAEHNSFLEAAEKARQEAEADAETVSVEFENELLKYGISANDPSRTMKLLAAKAAEQKAQNDEPEEEPVGDIF